MVPNAFNYSTVAENYPVILNKYMMLPHFFLMLLFLNTNYVVFLLFASMSLFANGHKPNVSSFVVCFYEFLKAFHFRDGHGRLFLDDGKNHDDLYSFDLCNVQHMQLVSVIQ